MIHVTVISLPNHWIVFFSASDLLLKLRIVLICYSLPSIFLDFTHVFPHFSEEKVLIGAGYPLIWCTVYMYTKNN